MIAASGDTLMQHEAAPVMREHLFPLATVVTPNLDEATFLCERKIRTLEEMQEAARAIHAMGPRNVLIKGGHLPGDRVVDPVRWPRIRPAREPSDPGRIPRDGLHALLGDRRGLARGSRCGTPWRRPRPTSPSPCGAPRPSDDGRRP